MIKRIPNVKISAIATCVPKRQVDIFDNKLIYGGNVKKLQRISSSTGFRKRHILEENSTLTAGDLCTRAAEELFKSGIKKDDIQAIIMVTQYPDYYSPATACVIHGKLGLSDDCIAYDINQGCCGYIFGILSASSMLSKECKKILLCVGDSATKITGSQLDALDDIPIFGDGGTATILEYDENSDELTFDMGTRGSEYSVLMSENGGFRNPPTKDMFDENGKFNYNNHMDGLRVFEFTMNIVPPSIKNVMKIKGWTDKDINYYILHQANKMILENIATSANIHVRKILVKTLSEYGNLSLASIPSVICDECEIFNKKTNKIIMTGFGVGLSWGSIATTLHDCLVLPIILY